MEQPDDMLMVTMKLRYDGVLKFQHDAQPIRGVYMQQQCIVHLPGHEDVGQHAVQ